ncbi:MAG TPA: HAD family phosphatase [Kineosporiaceae bacterium]
MPPDGPGSRRPTRLPAAVLWDLDGTLIDSEQYWDAATADLIAAHGRTWSQAHSDALIGNDLLTSARYIKRHGGVELPAPMIVDILVDGVTERLARHLPWRPGARELLAELTELDVPCALVTMSYRRLADAVVAALPAGSFAAVVAGDDVSHGKPHPEPYLTAAARLQVAPADCVAIEDSPTGLASAVAAGVPALGVAHLVPLEPSPGRHLVGSLVGVSAAGLGELPRLLGTAAG